MKKVMFGFVALMMTMSVSAQKFFTKDGNLAFDANSPLEKIEGKNKLTYCSKHGKERNHLVNV